VVTSELVAAGHAVVVLDNLSNGHRSSLAEGVQLVVGDVGNRCVLDRVITEHGVEAVMHFAASIEAGESMKRPQDFFHNNTVGSLTLLERMIAHGVSNLVFSSTAALYGNPERTPIEETATLLPTNPYGESKLAVERILQWYHRIHRLSYASLRYFNAAGATETLGEKHSPESHLIPIVLQVAAGSRETVTIYGTDYPTPDGTCVRDYIHVSDLASAHLLALDALRQSSQPRQLIYNLGSGRGVGVREVIDSARKVTGRPIPAVDVSRRPGDPAVLVASCEKIKRELGWRPRHTNFETIIASAWNWILKPEAQGHV
jgi:UDP-glucose 4-epimerase